MKRNKILALIAIILFISLLVLVWFCIEKLSTYVIEEHSFYQYYAGQKFEYEGGLKISRKNEITELVTNDIQVDLDSTPVYYKDVESKVLFPEDMIIVFPSQAGIMYKLNLFSNIYYDEDTAYLEENKNKSLNNAFLYDGEDLYFFLMATTLKVEDEIYELSPLSYVIYNNGIVEIYQKNEDKYTIIENVEKVEANSSDYTVNLKTDTVEENGTNQLLIRNKSNLKTF